MNFLICPGEKQNLPSATGLFFNFYIVFHLNDCSEFRAYT